MSTKAKIKIDDIPELRAELDKIYEEKTQVKLAQWALNLAAHVFAFVGYEYEIAPAIMNGFAVNRQWQNGEARMFDIRQAGLKVHRLARESGDPIIQAALRTAGQAIGTGHMREHAMVASDYAIKAINLKYPNDMNAVRAEREWQIAALK